MLVKCLCLLAVCLSPVAAQEPVFNVPLDVKSTGQWTFPQGEWQVGEGFIDQLSYKGQPVAILKEPGWGDCTFKTEFLVHDAGKGVHTAAIIFRATGMRTYYWLHIDSRHSQIILVRSNRDNSWLEIARARNVIITPETWHEVAVTLKGPEITVVLNGEQRLQATDTNISAGRIGLGASEGIVKFRNLRIEGEQVAMTTELSKDEPLYQRISIGPAAGTYQAFPDVCRLQNGDLLCVFYGGYGHVSLPTEEWPKGGRVCMVRSSDEGKTWSKPEILFDDDLDNRDPHISQMADGTVICTFFNYWQDGDKTEYQSCIVRSSDNGKTWETTCKPVTPLNWAVSAPVRQLADGSMLLGVYTEVAPQTAWGGVVRSTDGGETWSAPIDIGKDAGVYLAAETDVIQLPDGRIFAALRSDTVNMHGSWSTDGGLTWSAVHDLGFKGHCPHLNRHSSGAVILCHRLPNTSLHISRDDCTTWQGPFEIAGVIGAYPATVELKDGTVLFIHYEEGDGSAIRAYRLQLTETGVEKLPPM